ncbi:PREDICTED: protein penguin [Ceratosolen solmsi marchali]|uniref:Protein penguin n=1 Tax=Ceratosolen solmsi marchali TaxID=326594 RepID=A0AAJ6VLE7_9HYME|nr:PREDICTED: protein penguin [Ceratosolen solmsi marchali]
MKRQKSNSSDLPEKKKFKKSINVSKNKDSRLKRKRIEKKKKVSNYEKFSSKKMSDVPSKQKDSKFYEKQKLNVTKSIATNESNNAAPNEKPNWLEYKKQQKDLRDKRRAKKLDDIYDISIKAKKIGEELRRTKLSENIKEKLTKNLYDLIQNKYAKLIFSHDISRVIQWQLKYCNDDTMSAIMEEIKPNLIDMFYSKYAKNIIKTLLKRGSDNVKQLILQQCNGHVVKLLSSVISAPIFEKIYVEIASPSDKNIVKQEFYSDLYKKCKDPNVKVLADTFKDAGDMKVAILSTVKSNLIKILNKNLINSTIVHTVLYEYLSICSKEDRAEIIVMTRPLIAELSQTKDGAKAANLCIWHGTNKDRKLIMKALKGHVKDIITSEYGHLIILALLDCVDDTILLKKIILQDMLNDLNEIVTNNYGKRVILYLVARRDTHHFHPSLIEYLKEGDGNETSKKPADIREKELLDSVVDNLLEGIKSDIKLWLSKGSIQLVTLAILKCCREDKPKLAFEAIAKFITDPSSKLENGKKEALDIIEDPGLHLMLKKLIQMDSERVQKNELTFGEVLLEHLSTEVIKHWINFNRSCFLLITLLKYESEKAVSELKAQLLKIEELKSKKSLGALILLKKLN